MTKSWAGFWIILKKEVLDNLRDRRTLTTMGVSIIIGPAILFGFLWFAEKTVKQETDLVTATAVELPVLGSEHAPNLMNWLRQNNIEIVDAPQNPEQHILDGTIKVILVIEDDYATAFNKSKSAPLRLIHDSSLGELEKISFNLVRRAIHRYSAMLGSLRLQARGISPQITQPIRVNISDVASPAARNAQILNMMPYLIIIFIMAGGMYLAIDTTAGERENGSLEPLLTLPVNRKTILMAKLCATVVYSALTFLLVLLGLTLAFEYAPIDSINVSISMVQVAIVFLTCLPFVFVASALMVLVASFTRSYKEAQSYLSMVMLVPSLPLVVLGFLSPAPSVSNMWIPSLSQGLIIIETLKGEAISSPLIGLSMLASMVFAVLLATVAVKLYQREKILG